MKRRQTIEIQIKSKKTKAQTLRNEAHILDREVYKLQEERKKLCNHPSTKIVMNSYEEPGRVKYTEWREKVCSKCGKVLGTSNKENTWSEFK